jgi:hypothetical protein
MIGLLCFVLAILALSFNSKSGREAENGFRHQLTFARSDAWSGPANSDPWLFLPMDQR